MDACRVSNVVARKLFGLGAFAAPRSWYPPARELQAAASSVSPERNIMDVVDARVAE